ncbi:hypothetical protein TWF102_002445 [Orbilia oligospora]|uniref:Uncharacterized protein n=1 Tax=Orbilia oligospora TaxID=2813651 RepID=A0A7C8N1N0_ORBOL|nr:hypothetical protein TWF102_002445 [Orbilia oligospora]KAF3082159.1 hypothetical protein TWF706_001913 [Orbilia oligospora]KAF3086687.1 hypothetical protein TWF103_001710 [Orbilia oligospora]
MRVQIRILDKLRAGNRWGVILYRFLLAAKQHLDAVWATNQNLESLEDNTETEICERCARRESSDSSDEDIGRHDTKRRFWADAGIFEHKKRCWGDHQFYGKADIPEDEATAKSTGALFEKMYSVKQVRVRGTNEPWISNSPPSPDLDSG